MTVSKQRQALGSRGHRATQTAGGHAGAKHRDKRAESPAVARFRAKMGGLRA